MSERSLNTEKIGQSASGSSAVEILSPAALTTPVIFASPHSGRDYPADLLRNSRLDRQALRQSEDSYVDLLFDRAPQFGSPLLRALFPRAYVDVNRSREELDPRMFSDAIPKRADTRSSRVVAGLGVIPRIVADGHDIYDRKLVFFEARKRLSACYDPYHSALKSLIKDAQAKFGMAIVVDCHSMPSVGGTSYRGGPDIDFVLGDRFGSSCAGEITDLAENVLRSNSFEVARNAPYAGGFVASAYGRPKHGVHVIQIEINRGLYLDERRIARTAGFDALRQVTSALIDTFTSAKAPWQPYSQAAE
ncbi:MAG: N-formylglutamate amidohydrolase [Pseudomonadota bacterium]